MARRRFTKLIVAFAAVAVATLLAGCGSGGRNATKCSAAVLRLSLQTRYVAGQSLVFLYLRNQSGSTCVASGKALYEVEQSGRRAKIEGNPLRVPVRISLGPGERQDIAPIWWRNWCEPRRHLAVVVRFNRLTIRSDLGELPVCYSPGTPSQMRQGSSL